ncbi:MAG: bifunctional glutamate N-acetyltransferase/amino-acid acetyltransferase ArgJ [Chitinispirillaceae bacterium]|nr:bifunctional glutamate N-acetyltransferase/amino-acid acetyltransferase ArgJ [Chitinispirillaceae bacterium]
MATSEQSGSIKKTSGGVTAARGFRAAGVKAGIKIADRTDLGLLLSDTPCAAAGTFTRNAIRASSVDWCSEHLPSSSVRAVICNSGCANACTGEQGENDTAMTAVLTSKVCEIPTDSVLLASTGVIGKFLPMDKIEKALPEAKNALYSGGGTDFAAAIMTTDLVKKESSVEVMTGKGVYSIGGCCKGSGMIHPNMATMLGFITTDAMIPAEFLNPIVKRVVDRTFNNLTVDGDTSTNDMVLVLSNGASGISVAQKEELEAFENALYIICSDLCKMIAADGEGATKRVEIQVKGASSEADAKKAAKSVAGSNLTKCALFGNDPNWGRIACAVGYSGAPFSNESMTINLCGVTVFRNLQPVPFDEKMLHEKMKEKVVTIEIDLGIGNSTAIAHTCDLTYDYVKINAEYRT